MSLFQSHHFRTILSSSSPWISPRHALYSTATDKSTRIPIPSTKPPADTNDAEKESPIPFLNKPLGILKRPSSYSAPQKRSDRIVQLLTDEEAIMEQRRMLFKQARKPYFQDMLDAGKKHGGKTWIAPKVLIREDKALYLPYLAGKSLDKNEKKNTVKMCEGRISVLAMLGTKISEYQTKGFITPTHTRFSTHPRYQLIQINLQENLLKAFVVKLFSSNLRSTVPPELQPTYLVSNQNLDYIRDDIGMTNSMVGYVFLIDENLKIRWAGCGDAMVEETQALESCTGVLLKRFDKMISKATKGNSEADDEWQSPAASLQAPEVPRDDKKVASPSPATL